MNKLRKLLWLLQSGQVATLATLLRRWLYSDVRGIGLQRGLELPIEARRPRHALTIRPISPHEREAFTATKGVQGDGALLRLNVRQLFATGLETCYVALIEDEIPVYIQYLVLPDQNDKVVEAFGESIPQLDQGEALLEFAFTLEQYRALGVMPHVFAELAKEAKSRGACRVVTWVGQPNPTMLRYLGRIGFVPFAIRTERYRLFRKTVRFERV